MLYSANSYGQWNFDQSYEPIAAVTVDPYASVQEIPGQDSSLCLGLAISGGGSRAQYFGTGVMMGLSALKNSKDNSFLNEVDYYSSVSGGGFAIGYYLMVRKTGLLDRQTYLDFWRSEIPYDGGGLPNHIYQSADGADIMKLSAREKRKEYTGSYPYKIDHQLLQSNTFQQRIGRLVPQLFLSDFFQKKCDTCKATLPMYVANATIYPNCERIPMMPHILSSLKINRSVIPEYFFADDSGYSMPLAFALASSSAVPGVLPILKFGLSDDPEKAIRIMDGGVVDNLGIYTLYELLLSDKTRMDQKKMLVIDCSGVGRQGRYSDINSRIKLAELIRRSSFFTVESRNMIAEPTLKLFAESKGIPDENFMILGIQNIKMEIRDDETSVEIEKIKLYQESLKIKKRNKEALKRKIFREMYKDLATSMNISVSNDNPVPRLGTIPTSDEIKNLSDLQKFLIYEMASHVITKIEINEMEQEILILAGRLVVNENADRIVRLIE